MWCIFIQKNKQSFTDRNAEDNKKKTNSSVIEFFGRTYCMDKEN